MVNLVFPQAKGTVPRGKTGFCPSGFRGGDVAALPCDGLVRIVSAVALVFGVSPRDLVGRRRGAGNVTRARHIAIYLAHTLLGLTQSAIADAMQVNRNTIAYACRRIEDSRDHPAMDGVLTALEAVLGAGPGGHRYG